MKRLRVLADRSCGTCTACCTRLVIPEIDKPFGVPCQFLRTDQPGCRIYERRPETCSGYSCLWLAEGSAEVLRHLKKGARRRFTRQLQPDERPDQLGVLFDYAVGPTGAAMLAVREVRRGALAEPRVRAVIARLQRHQFIVQVADG